VDISSAVAGAILGGMPQNTDTAGQAMVWSLYAHGSNGPFERIPCQADALSCAGLRMKSRRQRSSMCEMR